MEPPGRRERRPMTGSTKSGGPLPRRREGLEAKAGGAARDRADAGKIHMRAGDLEPIGCEAVEQPLARRAGGRCIDIEDEADVRARDLDGGEMHDIAPDKQAVTPRIAGASRYGPAYVPGDAPRIRRHHFALAHAAQAVAIRRRRHRGLGDIAADALART